MIRSAIPELVVMMLNLAEVKFLKTGEIALKNNERSYDYVMLRCIEKLSHSK